MSNNNRRKRDNNNSNNNRNEINLVSALAVAGVAAIVGGISYFFGKSAAEKEIKQQEQQIPVPVSNINYNTKHSQRSSNNINHNNNNDNNRNNNNNMINDPKIHNSSPANGVYIARPVSNSINNNNITHNESSVSLTSTGSSIDISGSSSSYPNMKSSDPDSNSSHINNEPTNSSGSSLSDETKTGASLNINKTFTESELSKALEDEHLCKICFEREMDAVLLNCGHQCACFTCANALTECPIDRKPIQSVIKVYKS